MNVVAIHTHVYKEREDIARFIAKHLKKIPKKSVLVIASKIIALSEGRILKPESEAQKKKYIKKESSKSIQTKYAWFTIKDNVVMANAGIDESNANRKIILLPKNSFASAKSVRQKLQKIYRVRKLGVIISDSHIAPLRAGITAHALGYAGIKGVRDYRGTKDIFGRTMRLSQTNIVDSLATAAALVMGEGNECQPLALITGAPVEFKEKVRQKEILIAQKDDLYWPLLKKLQKEK